MDIVDYRLRLNNCSFSKKKKKYSNFSKKVCWGIRLDNATSLFFERKI